MPGKDEVGSHLASGPVRAKMMEFATFAFRQSRFMRLVTATMQFVSGKTTLPIISFITRPTGIRLLYTVCTIPTVLARNTGRRQEVRVQTPPPFSCCYMSDAHLQVFLCIKYTPLL